MQDDCHVACTLPLREPVVRPHVNFIILIYPYPYIRSEALLHVKLSAVWPLRFSTSVFLKIEDFRVVTLCLWGVCSPTFVVIGVLLSVVFSSP